MKMQDVSQKSHCGMPDTHSPVIIPVLQVTAGHDFHLSIANLDSHRRGR